MSGPLNIADPTSRQALASLGTEEKEERLKDLEQFKKLIKDGVSRDEALKIFSIKGTQPKINWESDDYKIQHGTTFNFLTINKSKYAKELEKDFTKFSVFVGNGLEPSRDPATNNIAIFDPTDDDQQSIAAQFHVTSLSNVSIKNLIATHGSDKINLGDTMFNRSAIKARADAVEIKGNEIVIIRAGDRDKNSFGVKPGSPGGVHIYAGNPTSKFAKKSQPMVLGNNLEKALTEIYNTLQSLSSNITNINLEIMTMKTALSIHFHPPFAPPSPTLAPQFIPEMLAKDLLRVLNSFVDKINHKVEQFNRVFKFTDQHILSKHNTVN